jgi:hypothetical protein
MSNFLIANKDFPTISVTSLTTLSQKTISKPNDIIKPNCLVGDGYYADKSNGCKKYYICSFSNTPSEIINFLECPQNTLFDESIKTCNIQEKVNC